MGIASFSWSGVGQCGGKHEDMGVTKKFVKTGLQYFGYVKNITRILACGKTFAPKIFFYKFGERMTVLNRTYLRM
jgi:hypothetical protein